MSVRDTLRAMLISYPFLRTILRILAAVPFGYFLIAQLVSLIAAMITLVGMARSEAVVLASMLGFLIYLVWLIWAFAVRRLAWLYVATVGGLVLCMGLLRVMPQAGA